MPRATFPQADFRLGKLERSKRFPALELARPRAWKRVARRAKQQDVAWRPVYQSWRLATPRIQRRKIGPGMHAHVAEDALSYSGIRVRNIAEFRQQARDASTRRCTIRPTACRCRSSSPRTTGRRTWASKSAPACPIRPSLTPTSSSLVRLPKAVVAVGRCQPAPRSFSLPGFPRAT